MCVVCQAAMTVAAAVGSVLPGVAATEVRPIVEKPTVAEAAAVASSLKGKCARAGQTRTVKGVRYVCSKSKRWQVASSGTSGGASAATTTSTTTVRSPAVTGKLQGWEWASLSSFCAASGEFITVTGTGFSPSLALPAAWFSSHDGTRTTRPTASQVVRAESTVISATQIRVKVPERSQIPSAASAQGITLHLTGGALEDTSVGWGSRGLQWCSTSGGSGTGGSITTTVPARTDSLVDEWRTFTTPLARSTSDRPNDRNEPAQAKVIYVVPSFSTDRRRDVSGEIARAIFAANEWWASQNGGFGLRFDTFGGALDVGFMTVDMTKQEWYDTYFGDQGANATYSNGMSRFQSQLVRAGYWKGNPISSSRDSVNQDAATRGQLYLVVIEGPAGTYARTGANRGGCRGVIDAINDRVPIAAVALTSDSLDSCGDMDRLGRYSFSASLDSQRTWILNNNHFIDAVAQWMRNLPGCGPGNSPRDGERVRIPGVLDESRAWEIRGGFMRDLAETNDPLNGFNMGYPQESLTRAPAFDPRNDLYFHITSDRLASVGACNSDISKHPLWDNLPLDRNSGRTLLRSSYDRPDDKSGAQFHAVYVVRNGGVDRMYDTSGDIERALRHADQWLRAESGKGMRLDTYQGRLDVTYLPLPPRFESTTGKDCNQSPCPNDQDFYAHLRSLGRVDPNKTYLFFYSGGVTGRVLCGGAGVGKSVLLNLEVDGRFCSDTKWTESTSTALSWGLLALHETFHSLGAVCIAAPDSDGSYHSSIVDDIMHARAKGTVKLDVNRRNYWGSVPAGCVDASQSPLFES